MSHFSADRGSSRADKDGKPAAASGPLFAVVSLADQRISFYGGDGLVARAPISSGMRGHLTPTGVFVILQKRRWHTSNIYSGAPMPFMQRLTWSGIAMHAGALPGYPASHGCIRLPYEFAQRVFAATEIGQRVMISPRDTAPVEISHKNLPVPTLWPAPEGGGEARATAPVDATGSVTLPGRQVTLPERQEALPRQDAQPRKDSVALETVSLSDAPVPPARLNPLQYAQAMKRDAAGKLGLAARSMRAAVMLSASKMRELRIASRRLASAENALDNAGDKLAASVRRIEKAEGEEAVAKATEAKVAVEAALSDARKAVDEARAVKEARQAELAAAQRAVHESKAAGKAAAEASSEASRRLKPVSVFISRKTGKLYVRQDFGPLFDTPVTIRDPERPVGTHIIVSARAAQDGAALHWMATSMAFEPDTKSTPREGKRGRGAKRAHDEAAAAPVTPAPPMETAHGALDRVTIPDDAAKRLADLSWVGASIIISDQGISGETNDTTDFVVLTRNRASAQ